MRLALAGQTYSMRSLAAAAQTCTNLYPEKIEDPAERAKAEAVLFGCPGRHLFKNLTVIDAAATPLRGIWTGGGRCFVFAGTKYFEISSAGALIGSVRTIANPANYPVQAFGNGNQLMIVSNGQVYIDNGAGPVSVAIGSVAGRVNTDGGLVTWVSGDQFPQGLPYGTAITIDGQSTTIGSVSDPTQLYINSVLTGDPLTNVVYTITGATLTGVTGAYLKSYFAVNRPSGGSPDLGRQINYSAILDGTSWFGTDTFQKAGYPDYCRSILANNDQLIAFGTETIQFYTVTADTTVFQPIDGTMANVGSISPWGPVAINNQVFFVGGAKGAISAYVLDGYTPRRISTHAIEEQWNAAALGSSCVSYAYQEEGHCFWVIYFPTPVAQTWVYDTITGAWHERKLYTAGAFAPAVTCYHAYVEWPNGTKQHLTGGPTDAKVYDTSVNFYDDDGADMQWERCLPYLYNGGKRIYCGRMDLEMETGTVASGAEPVVSRASSDDRGHTFSTDEDAGIGLHNDYSKVVSWPLDGSCDTGRVYRLRGHGQSKIALVALNLDVEMGSV